FAPFIVDRARAHACPRDAQRIREDRAVKRFGVHARATCERLQETFDVERRADDLEADVGSRAYDARVALRVHVRYEADFLAAACVLWPNACDEEAGVAYRRARLEPARGGAQVASHGGKAHVAVRSDSLCTEANSGSHHDLGSVQRIQARVDDRAGT